MWYQDVEQVRNLGQALSNAGVLEDSADFNDFLRRPKRWDETYEAWEASGSPITDDDEGLDDFVSAISTDENESES